MRRPYGTMDLWEGLVLLRQAAALASVVAGFAAVADAMQGASGLGYYLLWAPHLVALALGVVALATYLMWVAYQYVPKTPQARDRRLGLWGLLLLGLWVPGPRSSSGFEWSSWAVPAIIGVGLLVVPWRRATTRSLSRTLGSSGLCMLCIATMGWLAHWRTLTHAPPPAYDVRLLLLQALVWGAVGLTESSRYLRITRLVARLQLAARALAQDR